MIALLLFFMWQAKPVQHKPAAKPKQTIPLPVAPPPKPQIHQSLIRWHKQAEEESKRMLAMPVQKEQKP